MDLSLNELIDCINKDNICVTNTSCVNISGTHHVDINIDDCEQEGWRQYLIKHLPKVEIEDEQKMTLYYRTYEPGTEIGVGIDIENDKEIVFIRDYGIVYYYEKVDIDDGANTNKINELIFIDDRWDFINEYTDKINEFDSNIKFVKVGLDYYKLTAVWPGQDWCCTDIIPINYLV